MYDIVLATKASEHDKEMEEKYREEIELSFKKSIIFEEKDFHSNWVKNPKCKVEVVAKDSIRAAYDCGEGKTAILNFASFVEAGGQFLNGSSAQEECLCMNSNLYNILKRFEDTYYKVNREQNNGFMYLNKGIYTPEVIFEDRYLEKKIDVITCACPNWRTARKRFTISYEDNIKMLGERCLFVNFMANICNVDTLILGAFGCGVFGQDPEIVSETFRLILKEYGTQCKKIVFAIPDNNSKNYLVFMNKFYNIKEVRDIK